MRIIYTSSGKRVIHERARKRQPIVTVGSVLVILAVVVAVTELIKSIVI